jgi:hypothetical protein
MRTAHVASSTLAIAALLGFAVASVGAQEAKPTYVGSAKCVQCHFKQATSWKKTKLAHSMDTLKPVTEAENKALFDARKGAGLDPAKDYTTDAKCLPCHVTGYGKEGGYPEAITEGNRKVAEAMGSVSCESCHGPGSVYLEYKKKRKEEAKKEGKEATFTTEELAKLGLVKPTEENCKTCHNEKSPVKVDPPFKFEEAKAKVHEHPAKK